MIARQIEQRTDGHMSRASGCDGASAKRESSDGSQGIVHGWAQPGMALPIPMPEEDITSIVEETNLFLEICSSGNPRMALRLMDLVKARRAFHRVVIGTDTPGGTGVIPRGMLRQIAFLSAVGGVAPEVAIAMATGKVARAHGLQIGILEEGKPADLVPLDRVQGSVAKDVMGSFSLGDLPGSPWS